MILPLEDLEENEELLHYALLSSLSLSLSLSLFVLREGLKLNHFQPLDPLMDEFLSPKRVRLIS